MNPVEQQGKFFCLASSGFLGPEQLPESLKGCEVAVIPAGVPRKPGMSETLERDLFLIQWLGDMHVVARLVSQFEVADTEHVEEKAKLPYRARALAHLLLTSNSSPG